MHGRLPWMVRALESISRTGDVLLCSPLLARIAIALWQACHQGWLICALICAARSDTCCRPLLLLVHAGLGLAAAGS